MVDLEVEETLREIRERVRATQARATATQTATPTASGLAALESPAAETPAHVGEGRGAASDALARLEANLSTTERAWDRLPPLLSNRTGWVARLELWVKRKIKRALHWITWEQVNFNSSVHHSLRDARAALAAHEQLLSRVQSESASLVASFRLLKAEADAERARGEAERSRAEADRTRAEARLSEFGARIAAAEARFDAGVARVSKQLGEAVAQLREEQRAHAENLTGAQGALVEAWRGEQDAFADGLRGEQGARLAEFRHEVSERLETLLDEQRVCFRQLSLEASEAALANERARRRIETRLDEIGKAVNRES